MIRRQLMLAGAAVALAVAGLFVGAASLSVSEVWTALGPTDAGRVAEGVVWDIRMPRIIGGVLVGGTLAAAGVALQGVFRNPIAEPYLLGFSSAAGLGLVIGAWLTPAGAVPILAATLAIATAGTVAVVVRRVAVVAVDSHSLILSGLAIGFALLAWTLILIFAVDSPRLPTFTYFVFGGLGSTTWKVVAVAVPFGLLGTALVARQARALDLVALGDVQAGTLGVDVAAVARVVLAAVALNVGAAVSVAGVVGFVGLLAPIAARRLVGPTHSRLIWAALSCGAVFVLGADVLIRAVATTVEVPLGVVTAAVGGPALVTMLVRRRAL